MSLQSVPFYDYARLYKKDFPIYSDALNDVLLRSDFIMRDDLLNFERDLAEYLEVKFVVGVANGTDAIWLALMAAGIEAGDEVILPSHTYVATADAVKFLGATPVLVDCQEDHLVSPAAIEDAITERTRAIIPVNLNGRACQLDRIQDIAKKHDLKIVEDNAQGLGAKLEGRSTGSFGESGTMSFFPAKNLGCLGDGGGITTNSFEVARKIRLLRNHGRDDNGEVIAWGLNSRLDNIQAAILWAKLPYLDETITLRRKLATLYCEGLGELEQIHLPPKPEEVGRHFDSYQNFEVEAENRNELREFLTSKGIGTSLPWGGKAVHHFNLAGVQVRDVSRTERLFSNVLLLPLNQYMYEAEAAYVVKQIRDFYQLSRAE